jgi:hypothetical protein
MVAQVARSISRPVTMAMENAVLAFLTAGIFEGDYKMSEFIDREKAIENIKAAYCCGCENYNGVRCRACQIMDAMDVLEDEPAVPVIDAKSMEKYLIDWKDGLTGSENWGYLSAIRAKQTVWVLNTILNRIGYMLNGDSGVQTDGKT